MRSGIVFGLSMAMIAAVAPAVAGTDTPPPPPASPADVVTRPVALTSHATTDGDYPALARARHEEGRTLIRYVVNTDGSVGDAQIEKSSGFADLDTASIELVKTWKFKPATKDGKPLAVSNQVYVTWKLTGPPPGTSPYFVTLHMTEKDYPAQAKAAKEEGFALVVVYLDDQGHILNSVMSQSTGYADLDQATTDMVSTRWKFTPAMFNGKPAASAVAVMVIWSLEPESDSGKAKQ